MLKFDKFILESQEFKIDEDFIELIGNHLESLILKNKILSKSYLNSDNVEDDEWKRDWEIGDEESDYFDLKFYFADQTSNMRGIIDNDIFKQIDVFKTFLKELQKVFLGLEIKIEESIDDYESVIMIKINHSDIRTNNIFNNLFKSSKGVQKYKL